MLWKLNILPAPSKHAVTVLQAPSMLLVPVLSWWCPVAAQKGEVLHRVRLPPRFCLSDGSHCGAEFLELDLWLVPCGLQVFLPLEREVLKVSLFHVSLYHELLLLQAVGGVGGCGAAGPCGQPSLRLVTVSWVLHGAWLGACGITWAIFGFQLLRNVSICFEDLLRRNPLPELLLPTDLRPC